MPPVPPALTDLVHALLESEETYRLVFAHEKDAMSLIDRATGRFIEVNRAWEEQYGYSREEALSGMGPADVIVEEEQDDAARAMAAPGSRRIDTRWHRRRDGSVFPVELTCGSLTLGGRDVVYAVMRDIGERVRASEALHRSESNFRTLIERLPHAVFVHRGGDVAYVNRAALDLLGYREADEVIGRAALDLVHPDDRDGVAERIERTVRDGENTPPIEKRFLRSDGTAVPVEVRGLATTFDGEPAALALVVDLTARKEMEAQLVTADRLASIGRLAASVGHEINNPLVYVLGNIELLRREMRESSDPSADALRAVLEERLAAIEQGAERVRDIVRDLGVLARREEADGGTADLHRTLDVCVDMAGHELRHRARVVKDYCDERILIAGSEGRLGQVFLNLVVNAAQAIAEGNVQDNEVRIRTHARQGHAVVDITDTGGGLPQDVDGNRIFEPFFTTKGKRGTGLGLSIVHHIVRSLGGSIAADRVARGGTRFRVTLPLAHSERLALSSEETPPPLDGPRRRVLVVDDEPEIGRVIEAWLEQYEVRTVHSGRQAIDLLANGETERWDVILCDLMMGDLTGMDVYAHVQRTRPGCEGRIVFMSGGAYTPRAQSFLQEVGNPCLQKPFGMRDAARAVRSVLLRG